MKQAILITAYKDFDQLQLLFNQFDDNFNFYIHIDKKSKVDADTQQKILKNSNVKHLEIKYKVNWGGFNHLKSYLSLCDIALKEKENNYFHLITGHDFPIKNKESFKELLNQKEGEEKSFLDYFQLPGKIWHIDGGFGRLKYYNFYDRFDAKTPSGKKRLEFIRKLQVKLNLKRKIRIKEQLYGGSTYWTLTQKTLEYVMNFTKENPSFLGRFKYTFCPEELYFQTVIMNSEHAKNVINDNLRFIDWENGTDGSPAFLKTNDFERVVSSDKLFARKINSTELIGKLENHIRNQGL